MTCIDFRNNKASHANGSSNTKQAMYMSRAYTLKFEGEYKYKYKCKYSHIECGPNRGEMRCKLLL